jgi:hypothetical protein
MAGSHLIPSLLRGFSRVPAIVSRLMSDITLRTTGDAAAPDHPPSVRRSFLLDPCVLLLPATVLLAAILLPFQPSRAFGLPAHPLLVHIPVVLVPLLGVAVVVLALRPAWRARYGPAAAVSAVVTMVGAILAAGAGEALRDRRCRPAADGTSRRQRRRRRRRRR